MHHINNCSIFHGVSWFYYMCFMHWRLIQMHSCYQARWIHEGNPQTPYGDCCCIHPNPISTRSLGARPPWHLAVYPMGNDDIAWDFWAYFQTEPNSSLVHTFFSPFLNFRIVVVWDSVCGVAFVCQLPFRQFEHTWMSDCWGLNCLGLRWSDPRNSKGVPCCLTTGCYFDFIFTLTHIGAPCDVSIFMDISDYLFKASAKSSAEWWACPDFSGEILHKQQQRKEWVSRLQFVFLFFSVVLV
jgi:hypothetical protein